MGGQLLVGIGPECASLHACSEASGVTNQPPVLGCVEPAPLNAGQPAIIPSEARATAFEHAISFESRRMATSQSTNNTSGGRRGKCCIPFRLSVRE